ncbi:MAG: division/cell wall cluster transcriptional repressor MraZ [Candidatus Komeilibacteria bacterium]|nr:division/cell wall cluster transcriptional repressor MraZ [Candidatus Komeilibacteria bacterium]
MLIGEYQHSLDDKGRLALPAKFRTIFKSGAVTTKGLDGCLFVYAKKDWQQLVDKLVKLPISQAKSRAFVRLMLGGAMDVSLDKQGRVNLPDYLISYAQLKKKVIVTGLYNRLEIWDESAWQSYKTKTEAGSAEIAETLSELGEIAI